MKKLLVVMLMVICFVSTGYNQEAKIDTTKWSIGIGLELGQYWANGDYTFLSSPVALNLNYKGIDDDLIVSGFIAPTIKSANDSTESNIVGGFNFTLFRLVSLGVGYKFWEKNNGFVSASEDRWFFSVGVGLLELKKW